MNFCDVCGGFLGGFFWSTVPPRMCNCYRRWDIYNPPPALDTGWICPLCGMVNNPRVLNCPCYHNTITTSDTTITSG